MTEPGVSVVIPSHNRPDLLRLCLDSVLRHRPAHLEIVVVDDASADGCVSAVAAALGVPCLRLAERGGFARAANVGWRQARGPIVQLLNDDTVVAAGWAEAGVRPFADARVGAVAARVLRLPSARAGSVSDDLLWVFGRAGQAGSATQPRHLAEREDGGAASQSLLDPPYRGTMSRSSLTLPALAEVDSAGDDWLPLGLARKRQRSQRGPVPAAAASAAFYRRSALVAVGGFDESFGAYFEDVDLSLRLRRAGWRIVHEPSCVVWHRVSASHGQPRGDLLHQQSRNEERLFWRHLPAGQWWHLVPLHAAVVLAKALCRVREGTLGPWLRGRLAGWFNPTAPWPRSSAARC